MSASFQDQALALEPVLALVLPASSSVLGGLMAMAAVVHRAVAALALGLGATPVLMDWGWDR